MARSALAHLYPWDVVGDPDAAARVRDLGVKGVALAAAYHSVRAVTPLHPRHRVVDAPHAALYVPIDKKSWHGRVLQPAMPSWMSSENPFGIAARSLRNAGLQVHAWVVLTHASRVGQLEPQFTVRNAFGDHYVYALCPAHAEVIEYCVTLVREVVQLGGVQGLILEAAGPLGFVHGSHHEKTEGADFDTVQQQLLSLCFCTACEERYKHANIDVDELRRLVCARVDSSADTIELALGEALAEKIAQLRSALARELRQSVIRAARALVPTLHIVLHASADPWATGAFASVADGVDTDVDTLVANCWAGPEGSIAGLCKLRALPETRRLAAYVLALPPRPCDAPALQAELDAYAEAGADEFHFYHAGLASRARLDAIRSACSGGNA